MDLKKKSKFDNYEHYRFLIADRTKDFVGRDWVFNKIGSWLGDKDHRALLLTGPPGSGKSAISARFVQIHQNKNSITDKDFNKIEEIPFLYFHFCQALHDATLDPLRFVESLSAELANKYQDFANALMNLGSDDITISAKQIVNTASDGSEVVNVKIESLSIGDMPARIAFERSIRKPLEQCSDLGSDNIVILIDGLDEALTYDPEENILNLLSNFIDHQDDLPKNVRFLLTSREDPRVLSNFRDQCKLNLINDAPSDKNEVRDYASYRLKMLPEPKRQNFSKQISDSSKGNFLYARHVLDDLLSVEGQITNIQKLKLPDGLKGVYNEFLRRELGRSVERWEDNFRPLLSALAVSRGTGLTRIQLAGLSGLPQSKADDILRVAAQYLIKTGSSSNEQFTIYHQSFRDFLLLNDSYRIYPAEANEAIANYFINEFNNDWLNCSENYCFEFIPTHLLEAITLTEQKIKKGKLQIILADLLMNIHFQRAKVAKIGPNSFLIDLDSALNVLPEQNENVKFLSHLLLVLRYETRNLQGWNSDKLHSFYAQQIHNRAKGMHLEDLVLKFKVELEKEKQPYLSLRWYASNVAKELEVRLTTEGIGDSIILLTYDYSKYIVAPSIDNTIRIWNLENGEEVRKLLGHDESVNALAVTPDGKYIVSASEDKTVRIWNIENGEEVRKLIGHEEPVNALTITPDGKYIVSASEDKTVRIWNLENGEEVRKLLGHDESVNALAVTPDGSYIVSGEGERGEHWPSRKSGSQDIKLWNLENGEEVRKLLGHDESVNALAVTPDGKYIVSASGDKTVRIWNIENGEEVRKLLGHDESVNDLAITPDGKYIVSASGDKTVRIWNLENGEEVRKLIGHEEPVNALAITPDGSSIVSGESNNFLVWKVNLIRNQSGPTGHHEKIVCVTVLEDNSTVFSISEDANLKAWNMATGELRTDLTLGKNKIENAAINFNGQKALFVTNENISLWDLQNKSSSKLVSRIRSSYGSNISGYIGGINDVTFSQDGHKAISAFYPESGGILEIWDLKNFNKKMEFYGEDGSENMPATVMIPNRKQLVNLTVDETIELIDLNTTNVLKKLGKNLYEPLIVTADGLKVIACSYDKEYNYWIEVWDIQTGTKSSTIPSHSNVTRNSDGLSYKMIETTKEYTTETGEVRHVKVTESLSIETIVVTNDSRYLSALLNDGTFRVWDLNTLQKVLEVEKVMIPAIIEESHYVSTLLNDGTFRVWDLNTRQKALEFDNSTDKLPIGSDSGISYMLVVSKDSNSMELWDLGNLQLICNLPHVPGMELVMIEPHKTAIFSIENGLVIVYDLQTEKEIYRLKGHERNINSLRTFSDGQYLATGSSDNSVRIWDLSNGKEVAKFIHDSPVASVTITPDEQQLLSATEDGVIRVWDIQTNKLLRRVLGVKRYVTALDASTNDFLSISYAPAKNSHCFNIQTLDQSTNKTVTLVNKSDNDSDHKLVVSGIPQSDNFIYNLPGGILRIYNIEKDTVSDLTSENGNILSLNVSSDGNYAISGSERGQVNVWSLTSNQKLLGLLQHKDAVLSVLISSDNKIAISGGVDRTIKLLDIASGQENIVATIDASVEHMSISSDGQALLVGDRLGSIYCFNLSTKHDTS